MNMNLFQEALHSSSATPAAASAAASAAGNSNNNASASTRTGTSSLGVMNNVSKLFFASNRRASNESMYSTKSSNSASGAARHAIQQEQQQGGQGEEPLLSEEAFQGQQAAEQARMDEFKTILAEVRLANPGISMAQAQHLTILKISERKNHAANRSGSDRGSDDADGREREDKGKGGGDGTKGAANKLGQSRRRRRSLVALEGKDENKHKLLLQRQQHDNDAGGGGGNLAPPTATSMGGFLRRNTRNLNPLTKSLPVKDGIDDNDGIALDDTVPDRHQPLLRRSSVRDPMLQSIRQLQQELGEVDLSEDDGGGPHDAGAGRHSGNGSGGGTGSRRRGSGSMFRRRGSHASRGSGGRLRRRTSAASSRSDLSIRSERSLEAERIRKRLYTKKSDGNKKKGSGIRSSAKKLLRLGSHGSSKKMRDVDSESAGRSQSGDHAQHRPKRRASQAPSLPDIGEDEDYESPIKSDGDTSNSGKHVLQGGGRRYSDISIEVPVGGDLICRWDNLSRDSIGCDSHISFDESDGLICGWANASNNGSYRRHTMAGSSSGNDFSVTSDDDYEDESENRRGSM